MEQFKLRDFASPIEVDQRRFTFFVDLVCSDGEYALFATFQDKRVPADLLNRISTREVAPDQELLDLPGQGPDLTILVNSRPVVLDSRFVAGAELQQAQVI